MENRECEFNLLDEPWIKVMKRDGTIDEVSLITVFEQAHLYTDLAGELATQNVAAVSYTHLDVYKRQLRWSRETLLACW